METKPSHGKIRRNLTFITVPAAHLLCEPGRLAFLIHSSVTVHNADKTFPHRKKSFETWA